MTENDVNVIEPITDIDSGDEELGGWPSDVEEVVEEWPDDSGEDSGWPSESGDVGGWPSESGDGDGWPIETEGVIEEDSSDDDSGGWDGTPVYDESRVVPPVYPNELPTEGGSGTPDYTALSTTLNLTSESFSLEHRIISLSDLVPTLPHKESRKETFKGLTQSIKELGILSPIHVLETETYRDFRRAGNSEIMWNPEENGSRYILIDGFRRVWAGMMNKLENCPAVVWTFEDMDLAMDLLTPLSLLVNKSQKRSWSETWGLFTLLETISFMTPSTLEFLLQLEPGESMKLKDIMLSDYDEVREALLSGSKTLTQTYNQLQKLRKEEDTLGIEDMKSIADVQGAEGVLTDVTGGEEQRTIEEVKKLLEFGVEELDNLSEEDFLEVQSGALEIDRGRGEDIPKELKLACLARDNYTCQVSGYGFDSKIPPILSQGVLQVHHIIPLYLGGSNHLDNLITVKMDHHTNIHIIERNGGKLYMSEEDFHAMDEKDRIHAMKTMKLAQKIVEVAEKKGIRITDKKLQEASRRASQFRFPGSDLKDNMGV